MMTADVLSFAWNCGVGVIYLHEIMFLLPFNFMFFDKKVLFPL